MSVRRKDSVQSGDLRDRSPKKENSIKDKSPIKDNSLKQSLLSKGNSKYMASEQHKTEQSQSKLSDYEAFKPKQKTKLEGSAAVIGYLKLMFLSYDFNVQDYLAQIDSQKLEQMKKIMATAPGYKPLRIVYGFYTHKYGVLKGLLLALLYPLPYSLLFLMILMTYKVPLMVLFALAGMRSGAIGINIKYFLHLPKYGFQWIVFLFTIFISLVITNNFIFALLYVITIFLTLFIKNQLRVSTSQNEQGQRTSYRPVSDHLYNQKINFNQMDAYRPSLVQENLPETYPKLSLIILILGIAGLFVLQKFAQQRQIGIFSQIFPLSLLPASKEIIAFFPAMFIEFAGESLINAPTLIAAAYLFPGPQAKLFMYLIYHDDPLMAFIAYLCLYLPSILICNVFIGNYALFCTPTYYNIRMTMQAVSNGLVFFLVVWMLQHEGCFFTTVTFTSVVIFAVAKLYRLRELAAMSLGIFLVSARSIILYANKGIPFQTQACLPQN